MRKSVNAVWCCTLKGREHERAFFLVCSQVLVFICSSARLKMYLITEDSSRSSSVNIRFARTFRMLCLTKKMWLTRFYKKGAK